VPAGFLLGAEGGDVVGADVEADLVIRVAAPILMVGDKAIGRVRMLCGHLLCSALSCHDRLYQCQAQWLMMKVSISTVCLGKLLPFISDWRTKSPGAWDKTHGQGFVYVHTVICKRGGERVRMYKVGRSRDPHRREGEWQSSCPNYRHRLVSVVEVRYQARTGEFLCFISFIHIESSTEYWLHKRIKTYRFSMKCSDCGKNHREIFAIPGGKRKVVRDLEQAAKEMNEKLTDVFGL
jgi:hypothetical protein